MPRTKKKNKQKCSFWGSIPRPVCVILIPVKSRSPDRGADARAGRRGDQPHKSRDRVPCDLLDHAIRFLLFVALLLLPLLALLLPLHC